MAMNEKTLKLLGKLFLKDLATILKKKETIQVLNLCAGMGEFIFSSLKLRSDLKYTIMEEDEDKFQFLQKRMESLELEAKIKYSSRSAKERVNYDIQFMKADILESKIEKEGLSLKRDGEVEYDFIFLDYNSFYQKYVYDILTDKKMAKERFSILYKKFSKCFEKDFQDYLVEKFEEENDRGIISYTSREVLFILYIGYMMNLLSKKGKIVIFLPGYVIDDSIDKIVRKKIVQENWVESVINLEFNERFLVLSYKNEKVNFIDLSEDTENKCLKSIEEVMDEKNEIQKYTIPYSVIKKLDSYSLNMYHYKSILPEYIKKESLRDLIYHPTRGVSIKNDKDRRIANQEIEMQYIGPSNLIDGVIELKSGEQIVLLTDWESQDEKYLDYLEHMCLKDGMIVMTRTGTNIKTAIAEVGKRKIIFGDNLLGMEIKFGNNPYYVQSFLQSEYGYRMFEMLGLNSGKMVAMSEKTLSKIQIPRLTKAEEEEIGKKYKELLDELKYYKEKIEEKKVEIFNLWNGRWEENK